MATPVVTDAEIKKAAGPVCKVCGKPLKDPKSQERGTGPVCTGNHMTKEELAAHRALISAEAVPEGWLKLSEVAKELRVRGIPVARLVHAVGGDRGMKDPVDPIFKPLYVGRNRWLNPEVLQAKGLAILNDRNLGKEPVKKEPKAKKAKAEGEAAEAPAEKVAKKVQKPAPAAGTSGPVKF